MRRATARIGTRAALAGVVVLALAGCGRHRDSARAPTAQSPAVPQRPAGATAAASGEVGPAAFDTTLVPRGSPDSTGKLGAPGYGFRTGGEY